MGSGRDYRELMRYLRRAALLSERLGDRILLREVGIGHAPYLTLRAIAEAEHPPSQQSLADQLNLTKGAVSRQIALAQRNGWLKVEGSPRSRRENVLALTRKGHALIRAGYATQARYEGLASGRLKDGDVAAATRVLRVFCEILEEEEKR